MIVLILLGIILSDVELSSTTHKEITLCNLDSKDALIGAYLHSKTQGKCYQANLDGKISFSLIENDSIQFEYTGYDLLNLAAEDVLLVDTVFMSAGKDVDLGSTGILPFLEADKYRAMCKCCSQNKN